MRWFLNLKIGIKLIIGFTIVSIIAGIIGIVGSVNIKRLDDADTALYETMTVPLGEMVIIADSFQRMRGNVKDLFFVTTPEEINDLEKRIASRNEEFNTNLLSYKNTLFTDEGRDRVEEIFRLKSRYDQVIGELIDYLEAGERDAALAIVFGEENVIRRQIEENYRRLAEIKVAAAAETAKNNSSLANTSMLIMIVLIIVGMVLSITLGIIISNVIKKPLSKMVVVANEMANGNLDVELDIRTKDEVGELAQAFRIMTENINDVMTNISSASEQVAAGAKQVSDSSMELSQGATEQASSIQQLTASVEEISA